MTDVIELNGKKYALVRTQSKVISGSSVMLKTDMDTYFLKPLPQSRQWSVENVHGGGLCLKFDLKANQAQATKSAIEELMRVITETNGVLKKFPPTLLLEAIDSARGLLDPKGSAKDELA